MSNSYKDNKNYDCLFHKLAQLAWMKRPLHLLIHQQKQELKTKETGGGYSFVIGACATPSICQEDERDNDGKLVLIICLTTLYLITSVTLSNTYS